MCQPCLKSNVSNTAFLDSAYIGSLPEIDQLVQDWLKEQEVPGAGVGVVTNNAVSYLKGYGFARLGNAGGPDQDHTPWTVGTPSMVGSISKTITALGILRLYERGLIDLEAHVLNYVPFIGPFPYGNPHWLSPSVTIRKLLSHTTGLPTSPVWSHPSTEAQLQATFPSAGDHPGEHPRFAYWGYETTPLQGFEGSSTARYSNTGYALLGAVIDGVSQSQSLPAVEHGYQNFSLLRKICG